MTDLHHHSSSKLFCEGAFLSSNQFRYHKKAGKIDVNTRTKKSFGKKVSSSTVPKKCLELKNVALMTSNKILTLQSEKMKEKDKNRSDWELQTYLGGENLLLRDILFPNVLVGKQIFEEPTKAL